MNIISFASGNSVFVNLEIISGYTFKLVSSWDKSVQFKSFKHLSLMMNI